MPGSTNMISRSNDKAIEIKGNDAALFNDRGALYEELGGYDQAIELNPNYALAFSNRCSAQYKKDYQIAINDCGRAIRLDQSGVSASSEVTPLHLQKDADALNDYSQAIKQAPNPAAAIFGRAPGL